MIDSREPTKSNGPDSGPNETWHRAVETRDRSFDGVFFVAITSTGIYCRPICPSRLARPENRRFFLTRTDAEKSGYRACRRCRPELAPGQAPVDAVPRRAQQAAERISAGELDSRSVRELARDLRVSDRHLRRSLSRELGASPFRLALAQRLHTATRLLIETRDPITFVAYASGFRSLRRFNAAFRQEFQLSPTEWRRKSPHA
jgi:AraC family transcriptional regulator of adaptative response / DNA-3-methyladenine glycosylase II